MVGLAGPLKHSGAPTPGKKTDDDSNPEEYVEEQQVIDLGEPRDSPLIIVDDQEVVVGGGEIDLPALREDRERSIGEHRRAEEDDDDQRRDVPEKLDVKGGEPGHQPVLRKTGYADHKTHHRGENDPEEGGEEGVLDPNKHHLPYRRPRIEPRLVGDHPAVIAEGNRGVDWSEEEIE